MVFTLVATLFNFVLAVGIYFLVKKLAAKAMHAKRWAWLAVVMWYAIPLPYIWLQFTVLPLPSDEYMTQHFNEHRAEFELLVKAYRNEYLITDQNLSWDSEEEVKVAKKKSDTVRLSSNSGMRWFENPYSIEAAQSFAAQRTNGSINVFKNHSFDGVTIEINGAFKTSIRERAFVYKEYLHIPQVPKIEDGKLWYPVNPSHDKYPQRYMAVKNSLDHYPDHWQRGECFVKPLSAQWFIQLCKSY